MNDKFLCICLFISILINPAAADNYPRNPKIDITHYVFRLALNDINNQITGKADVTIRFLSNDLSDFALDLDSRSDSEWDKGMQVRSVIRGNYQVSFNHENDRLIIIPEQPIKEGLVRTYRISYEGIPEDGLNIFDNKHRDRTFFGDNWPDRAHFWLPTVDHPSDKATCEFIITAPSDYQVVATGGLYEETDLGNGLRRTHWRSIAPIATKVMTIGVARFAVQHLDETAGVSIQNWIYPQDREAGFYDYALSKKILKFYSEKIGPYAFAKLANIQSTTHWGGLESAGAILYHENSVTGTRNCEGLLAHEIAHQWFGDAVTEKDWFHIWLSEGFATYLTHVYFEHAYSRKRLIQRMKKDRRRVIDFFKRRPHSIILDTTITNLSDILSTNTYQKAGWFLHMLRRKLGEDHFWKGLRSFYKQYKNSNVLTADFKKVMEEVSGMDLSLFFQQWLIQPGQPQLRGSWTYEESENQLKVRLTKSCPPHTAYIFPLDIGIYRNDKKEPEIATVLMDSAKKTTSMDVSVLPDSLVLDPHVWLLFENTFSKK